MDWVWHPVGDADGPGKDHGDLSAQKLCKSYPGSSQISRPILCGSWVCFPHLGGRGCPPLEERLPPTPALGHPSM